MSMSQTDPNLNPTQRDIREELPVLGEQLLSKVRELIHEGNVRRIIIKQEGHTIMEIPLTVGLVGAFMAPALAAIGAIGALLAQCSIEVVRSERPSEAVRDAASNVSETVSDIMHDEPSAL